LIARWNVGVFEMFECFSTKLRCAPEKFEKFSYGVPLRSGRFAFCGSVFIQEKIWDKYSKFVSGELSDLQHCAGTYLMNRIEFNNVLGVMIQSVDDAGIMAVKISEMINPELTAEQQAFLIAGLQECIKWLLYTDR
jgi:hypothetical protein